jgi:dTDP-glucose 4,6-dehydratase
MAKKKLLITGGAGFIGGNFVQYMLGKYPDYEIYNLDALTYAGDLTKHRHIEKDVNYYFINLNILDESSIYNLFDKENFDYVVHFAAESHVDRSIADPGIFTRTNVLGTQILLEASRRAGIVKFVHISTDEVYGELEYDSYDLFTEESPLQPNSPYSASKASSDLLVRAYNQTYNLPVNITRCSNNYGPFQFPEKLIPLTISRAINNQKVPIYGDGKNIRDWLHVYDHCTAIDLVLHYGSVGEIYNIGGKNERTNLDVVKTILRSLNRPESLIEFVSDRPGHDKRYAIDAAKLEKLGWMPKYKFEVGIKQTIEWYLENEDWWRRIISGDYRQYIEKHLFMK